VRDYIPKMKRFKFNFSAEDLLKLKDPPMYREILLTFITLS